MDTSDWLREQLKWAFLLREYIGDHLEASRILKGWLYLPAVGDSVAEDEVVYEIETDKAMRAMALSFGLALQDKGEPGKPHPR
ncbi:unnamed protein product, partial [Darwinula stevensoni]